MPYSVLVCDGDPLRCETIAAYLTAFGFVARSFTDEAQALDAFREDAQQFDLVITSAASLWRSVRAMWPTIDVIQIAESEPNLRPSVLTPGVVVVGSPITDSSLKRAIALVLTSGLTRRAA